MSRQVTGCWFDEGLRFSCTQCGDCCTGAPGYVWVDDEEIAALAAATGLPALQFVREVPGGASLIERANGDCIFWNRHEGCTVYSARPRQCRSFPFWRKHLRTPRAWAAATAACPGAGNGRYFTRTEIERIRDADGDL